MSNSVELAVPYDDVKSVKWTSNGKLEIFYGRSETPFSLINVLEPEHKRILKEWKTGKKLLTITYNERGE